LGFLAVQTLAPKSSKVRFQRPTSDWGAIILSAALQRVLQRDLTLPPLMPKNLSKIRATLVSSTAAGRCLGALIVLFLLGVLFPRISQ
jgi:hypothetical protein